MDPRAPFDQAKADAFFEKANQDLAGGWIAAMCALGDRLGLFRALAEIGPATSHELARRAEVDERYAREWLAALSCAGYLDYTPSDGRFTLPLEHAPVLAGAGTWQALGGPYQLFTSLLGMLDPVAESFRQGGGVPPAAYPPPVWHAVERCTAPTWDLELLPKWLPAMPEVQSKLEAGALVADIGCGHGRALITLARAFPRSRFVGYDAHGPSAVQAAAHAAAAGVGDRVRFEQRDVAQGLPDEYDVITTFDVVHDAVDPLGLLRAIRQALRPAGTYVLMDERVSSKLEENAELGGAFYYSVSVLYCMTISLAQGGAGLGTCGLPEEKVRELCAEAGFASVRWLPFENSAVYEVKP
jgi:SAM-dependent methyltransferase